MPHYFSEDNHTLKSNPKTIAFRVHNEDYSCLTDHGVFAKDGLDRGTSVLLKFLEIPSDAKTALDLGCGYGAIGLVLAKHYALDVDMIDINKRAVELSTKNVESNQVQATVFHSDGFDSVTKTYDVIVSNPPIRIGKQPLYDLFKQAKDYLQEGGEFTFVINKKHGAQSALAFVQSVYDTVTVVGKQKGFYVITCKK
jgi:16S rRNA (guanine1207-N2)-methyltransferase